MLATTPDGTLLHGCSEAWAPIVDGKVFVFSPTVERASFACGVWEDGKEPSPVCSKVSQSLAAHSSAVAIQDT